MAKGQMKGNKEAKKPKADKNQPSQGLGLQTIAEQGRPSDKSAFEENLIGRLEGTRNVRCDRAEVMALDVINVIDSRTGGERFPWRAPTLGACN
jgi:hypothetical protein